LELRIVELEKMKRESLAADKSYAFADKAAKLAFQIQR